MSRKLMLLATVVSAAFSGNAYAQVNSPAAPSDCRLRVSATPTAWVIQSYDPFGAGLPEAVFSASFLNEGSADCHFSPVFQTDRPPFGLSSGMGNRVNYAVLDMTSSVDATPRGGRSISGISKPAFVIGPKESKTLTYKFAANPNDIKRAGVFSQNVTLEAQDQYFRTLGGARITLALNVVPSARIGLAGAYAMEKGRAVVNLGELRKGPAQIPLRLRIQSIGTYKVSIMSQNSGLLKLGASDWTVPYSMTVGGRPVNFAKVGTVTGQAGETPKQEDVPIEFFIGDVSNRRAGVYSDTLFISVTAR